MPATTPILFPSGEDANPLNRRLPAEVVTRRRREAKKVEEKPIDEVRVDLKTALSLKPEARLKWLGKACKMAEEGRASTTELYGVISSRKFAAGVHHKIGRRMMDIVRENLGIFSDKQQRHLKSDDWVLNAAFEKRSAADEEQEVEADRKAESPERSGDERRKEKEAPPQPAPKPAAAAAPARTFEEQRPQREESRRQEERKQEERRPPPEPPRETESKGWTEAAAARGQGDQARREALLAEERARRKAREREEQDALMAGQTWAARSVGAKWFAVEDKRTELLHRREAEQQQAKKKQLEEEADSSLLALDRLMQPAPEPERPKEKERKRGAPSRSRSIASRSKSRGRGSKRRGRDRDGSYSVSVQRSRSRGRRRRGKGSGVRDKAAFDEALRRRMEEREAHDTTRIPVVDPGHAARMLGGHR